MLTEGVRKFAEGGYSSEADLQDWITRLHATLERELPSDNESRATLKRILESIYAREVGGGLARQIPGLERYTLDRVAPQLRAELDRRIFAAADLIRLNKRAAVEKTLQRFAGWVSSVPPAGAIKMDVRGAVSDIGKSIAQLKFEQRRVAIDQGHKLIAAVAHVVAVGQGAIAAIWHDRGEHDHGYDARPEHLKRSGSLFLVRDSWAAREGLLRKSSAVKYSDEFEQPAELPYCSCYYEYVTTLQRLPKELLTGRGRAFVSGKATAERSDSVVVPISAARRLAGNYRKGHIRFAGIDISIESRVGELRTGEHNGRPWEVVMPADYGYIRRTTGADGEQIDCYIGPNSDAPTVWVIQQGNPDSRAFDEQKVMLGFNSREIAIETYRHGFSDGKGRLRIGGVLELTVEQFKDQVHLGRTLLRAL